MSKAKCTKHTRSGPLSEVAMSKKCTQLWREDARSTFPSQNVQSTRGPDHFWKLRCRKSVRRFGPKHISKSICTNHSRQKYQILSNINYIHPWIHPAPWGPPFYRCKTEKWHFGICKMWSPPKNRLTVKLWSPGYSKTICFELRLCKMITL